MAQRVLVYGGNGALGSVLVNHFKSLQFHVTSIDMKANDKADSNVVLVDETLKINALEYSWDEQAKYLSDAVGKSLNSAKFNAIFCVAGGWAGGNSSSDDFIKNSDLVWKQSVWSSSIAAQLSAKFLSDDGLLTLTGAAPAVAGTPGMIGYGMAKAAVHQLTKSLASKGSGFPSNATVVTILPVTLDTPMNRKFMPKADFSTWTPLQFVAELFAKWSKGDSVPDNGSLIKLQTKDNVTATIPC